jgi:ribokinase
VGDDAEGRAALEPLRAAGVDVSHVRSHTGVPSRTAQIWVERGSGERAVLGCRDPRLVLEEADLPLEIVRSARLLHLDTSDPRPAATAARAAHEAGIPVVLDADAPGAGLAELLPLVDFPVVSRAFAETLFGTSRVREALERLLAAGARMAVVTLGDRGALARCGSQEIRCPAWPVEARDTTGAGDAFLAGLVWGLLEGFEAGEVLRAAAAAAAHNCRAPGAQGGLPDRAELRAFLEREQPGPWIDPDAP